MGKNTNCKATAFLLLGTNLGDRLMLLREARQELKTLDPLAEFSPIYSTAPWGVTDQPEFLNQAVRIRTELPPLDLLQYLKGIEQQLGRTSTERWTARVMDIDILFMDDVMIALPEVEVPHPRIRDRRFALAPLADLAPDFTDPVTGNTIRELLRNCPDPLTVKKFQDS